MARDHMKMRVRNGLASSLANVDSDVVTVRYSSRFDVTPNRRQQSPNGCLFIHSKGEKILLVSPRNNQAMSPVQWERIEKGHSEVIRCDEIPLKQPVTENTAQFLLRSNGIGVPAV